MVIFIIFMVQNEFSIGAMLKLQPRQSRHLSRRPHMQNVWLEVFDFLSHSACQERPCELQLNDISKWGLFHSPNRISLASNEDLRLMSLSAYLLSKVIQLLHSSVTVEIPKANVSNMHSLSK
jgi:hypothetical protein